MKRPELVNARVMLPIFHIGVNVSDFIVMLFLERDESHGNPTAPLAAESASLFRVWRFRPITPVPVTRMGASCACVGNKKVFQKMDDCPDE